MPAAKREWTVADVHALPDDGNRYEVIDGELFVTPAPAYRHQRAAMGLWRLLDVHVRAERLGVVMIAPADVIFSPRRGVQPDVFVVPFADGRPPERWEDVGRMLLAVEVLSPFTARADRVTKRALFRDEGVPEYWVVDLDAQVIERSTPADDRVEIVADRLTWQPDGATEPLVIDLPSYFARVDGAA